MPIPEINVGYQHNLKEVDPDELIEFHPVTRGTAIDSWGGCEVIDLQQFKVRGIGSGRILFVDFDPALFIYGVDLPHAPAGGLDFRSYFVLLDEAGQKEAKEVACKLIYNDRMTRETILYGKPMVMEYVNGIQTVEYREWTPSEQANLVSDFDTIQPVIFPLGIDFSKVGFALGPKNSAS